MSSKDSNHICKPTQSLAKNNSFSVYGSNYVEISLKYNGNLDECNNSNTIYKKWFETIYEEIQTNVNVLQEITEVRDGVKACESLVWMILSLMTFVLIACSKTSIL